MIRASKVFTSVLTLPLLLLTACNGDSVGTTDTATGTESDTDTTSTGGTTSGTTSGMTTMGSTSMGTTTVSTSTASTTDTGTSSGTETTGVKPDCTAQDGQPDQACDAATPFCVAGKCVDCSAANNESACETLNADTPVCTDAGACVQCTASDAAACGGTTPICDEATSSCVGCTEHAQCGGEVACNLGDGSCFAIDYVLYVDKAAADCAAGTGAIDTPFCTLAEAFTKIAEPDNLPAAWTVHIKAGTYTEPEHKTPDSSVIALLADGPIILRSSMDGAAGLTTGNASTLFLQGILFSLASGDGLKCSAATLWADDIQSKTNNLLGLETIDCTTHVRRALISGNKEGGVASIGNGITHIESSYVTANGTAISEFGGIRSAQGNELHVLYSSVINNDGDQVASLQCIDAMPADVRNSVLIGRTNMPSVDCMTGMISHSLVDGGDMQGDGNMIGMAADLKTWFENPIGGIFRVKPLVNDMPSPIAEVAMWMTGDPALDYDGNPRPATDASPDFPGADVPAP